jgi:hypothetical protein
LKTGAWLPGVVVSASILETSILLPDAAPKPSKAS